MSALLNTSAYTLKPLGIYKILSNVGTIFERPFLMGGRLRLRPSMLVITMPFGYSFVSSHYDAGLGACMNVWFA